MVGLGQRLAVSQDLVGRIRNGDKLPALPTVTGELLKLIGEGTASAGKIAAVVGQDPVVAAKVLKIANSSLFGGVQEITSLQQAIVALGMRSLKVLSMSISMVGSFDQQRVEWFDYQAFWRRSLSQAVAAKLLAKRACPDLCDEAFVAGLVSNLGVLALAHTLRAEYVTPYRNAAGDHNALVEAEQACLGLDHAEMAYALFTKWRLPEGLRVAVRLHHRGSRADLDPQIAELVQLTCLGAQVADLFCDGACKELLEAAYGKVETVLGLSRPQMDAVLRDLDNHVRENADILNVDIGQTVDYDKLQEQAAVQVFAGGAPQVGPDPDGSDAQAASPIDEVSGLPSRAGFDRHIERAFRQAVVGGKPLGLLLCTVEPIGAQADALGESVTNLLIGAAAEKLREFEARGAYVARYGRMEFALVVSDCNRERTTALAMNVAQRFGAASVVCSKGTIRFKVLATGVSTDSQAGPSLPELLARADDQLRRVSQRQRPGAKKVVAAG